MKYAKYILFLVTLIFASCTIEEPEQGKGSKIQFVGRAVPFNEHDVDTRAQMTDEEAAIKTLDYLIFVYIGNGDKTTDFDNWACVFYRHSTNSMEMINKEEDFPNFYDKGNHKFIDNAGFDQCYVAIVANYPKLYETITDRYENAQNAPDDIEAYINDAIEYSESGDGTYLKLSEVLVMEEEVDGIFSVPEDGLPRLGNYTEEGSNYVNLNNLTPGKPYTVNLKSLYAKMVFDISVDPNQESVHPEVDGVVNNDNTFSLTGYTVYNVPKEIDFSPTTNVVGEEGKLTREEDGQVKLGDKGFTFYLPERYFTPSSYTADNYPYPFRKNDGTIRPEDQKLRQRYKPKLVEKADGTTDATYVRFTGDFINHQGHSFEVSYDIYVGSDNYGNFDVVRNTQYNNIITIRGIDNSSDQSNITDKDGNLIAVSIDHRVNVTRQSPIIVNFRRETLLDAHFEVRPLRIILNKNHTGARPDFVKVEVLGYNETTGEVLEGESNRPNWIRLERSYGKGSENTDSDLFCDGTGELGKSSAGKRKYFTYGLVSGLQANGTTTESNNISANTSVTIPLTELNTNSTNPTDPNPNGCVWIYADECLDYTTSGSTDNVRSALIRVTCGSEVIDYVVNQHKLFKIDYTGEDGVTHSYYIEQEEEYLYNFDADDNFTQNQTFDEGMKWGLYNTQLSDTYKAVAIPSGDGIISGIISWFMNYFVSRANPPYFDFYVSKHDKMSGVEKKFDYAGYTFTEKIVNKANINVIALNARPSSAIQYCYSRNKVTLDQNGDVEDVIYNWYLPAIDEMEDIMMGGYSDFLVFQDKFYWSSQPAYYKSLLHYNVELNNDYDYYVDNIERARATKAIYKGNNNYDYAKSGAGGIYSILYTRGTGNGETSDYNLVDELLTEEEFEYTYYVWVWNWLLPSKEERTRIFTKDMLPTYEEGNKLRTAECRVRAVRRMTTTTTN